MGYSSAMAKAKTQTTHNQFQKWHKKWHQENLVTKTQISLSRGVKPQIPEEHTFNQAQERPEEDAGKQCKGNECVQKPSRVCQPKVAQPKMPNGPGCTLGHLAFLAHPKLGNWIRSYLAKSRRLCQSKLKD